MTLLDILKLIQNDYFPPVMELKNGEPDGIDTRPQSVFEVTICFMCEEPWYECEVDSIHPDDVHRNAICVWLKDEEYLRHRFWNCFETVEKEGD